MPNKTFNKGEAVPASGTYVCVPCGYRQHHKSGDTFGECTSCLAGTEEGDKEYIEGTSLWEKIEK